MRKRIYSHIPFKKIILMAAALVITVSSNFPLEAFEYTQPPLIRIFCDEKSGLIKHTPYGKYGQYSGYIYDYLYEIAQHNNWLYKFVPGEGLTPAEMLEQDKADIAVGISKSDILKYNIVMSENPVLKTSVNLYVMAANKHKYNIPEKFKGTRVGLIEGYSSNMVFEKFLSDKKIKLKLIYYKNLQQADDAMRSGIIAGAFIVGNISLPEYVSLFKFENEPLYFASGKNNRKLIDQIDSGINTINEINSEFTENLYRKYFSRNIGSRPVFTKDEIEYLNSHTTVKAGSGFAGYPFEFKSNNSYAKGIGPDVIEILREYTGLRFETVQTYNYIEATQAIKAGKIDLLPYVKRNFSQGTLHDFNITQPYMKTPVVMVKRHDENARPERIALPVSFSMPGKIAEIYPGSAILFFNSAEDCLNALVKGNTDAVFTNSDAAEYLLGFSKYSSLRISVFEDLYEEAAIAVSNKADPRLFSIINKGLKYIPENRFNSVIMKYSLQTHKREFKDIVKIYPFETGMVAAGAMTVIAIFLGYIALEKHREKKRMEKLYYYDEITGCGNFNAFLENTEKLINQFPERRYAIVRMNLVEFKFINDTFGYPAGDKILKETADMLSGFINKEYETFARIYADKFVLMLNFNSNSDLGGRIDMLCTAFENFAKCGSCSCPLIVNGGICIMDKQDISVKIAVDQAAFAEKELISHRHSNSFAYYNEKVFKNISNEKTIESSMRNALKNGRLIPYLQPKVNCRTLEVVGAEALVRWDDPDKGIIMPGQFIPYFEKSGFITELDLYMFEQACIILRKWIDNGRQPVSISCNFSYRDICDDTLSRIKKTVDKYDIPKELLEIEITETMAIENLDTLSIYGDQINKYGLKLCVDDFGAGYSSISLLQKMSIDILKFDRDLITRGSEKKFSEDILKGLIKTLKKHSVQIICEGIETEVQRDFVSGLGCDIIQGFLYSQPLPVEEFEEKYLKNNGKNNEKEK